MSNFMEVTKYHYERLRKLMEDLEKMTPEERAEEERYWQEYGFADCLEFLDKNPNYGRILMTVYAQRVVMMMTRLIDEESTEAFRALSPEELHQLKLFDPWNPEPEAREFRQRWHSRKNP